MEKILQLHEFGMSGPSYALNRADVHPAKALFRTIPPERVGLNGEYDHSGLAQRVRLQLAEAFGAKAIAPLSITQRGRVVVLAGYLPPAVQLRDVVQLAASIDGADEVETYGVRIVRDLAIAC